MSQELRVHRVVLRASHRNYEWRLGRGVSVITGPGDVGKTSLLNLIKWGLGGDPVLTPAIRTVGQQVGLDIEIGNQRLWLLRGVTRNRHVVSVLDRQGEVVQTLSTDPGDTRRQTISRYLLEALQIPAGIEVPRSRHAPTDDFTPLTFNDVFDYLYLDQDEIARSTIHHLEGFRDVKRMETFELLYRIMDTEAAELKRSIAQRRSQRERLDTSKAAVVEYLRSSGQPTAKQLEQEITRLTGQIAVAERETAGLRDQARRVGETGQQSRERLAVLQTRRDEFRSDLTGHRQQAERYRRVRAQLLQDLNRTVKAIVATPLFGTLEFEVCPRCSNPLEHQVPEGACRVCLQPESDHPDTSALASEHGRLDAQLNETDDLLGETERAVRAIDERLHETIAEIDGLRDLLDQQSRQAVAPYMDRVSELATEIGRLGAELQGAERSRGYLRQLEQLASDSKRLGDEITGLQRALRDAADEEHVTNQRIADLSELFAEILQSFGPLWLREAHIDRDTYLPIVNGERLEALGSGMKALVNTAYFLAGLTYAVRGYPTLLPRFMMIDGPRAHRGAGRVDRKAGERLYRWLMQLDQALQDSAPFMGGRGFQLIIADNDVPAFVKGLHVRRLSPDKPLLDDVPGLDDDELLAGLHPTDDG